MLTLVDSLPSTHEVDLAECIKASAEWSHGATLDEVKDIVQQFVTKKDAQNMTFGRDISFRRKQSS